MHATCHAGRSRNGGKTVPDPTVPPSNGADSTENEPRRSLRDTLEAAWEKVVEDAPDPQDPGSPEGSPSAAPQDAPVDSGTQPRDESGRWVKRDAQQGEAAPPPQQAERPAPKTSQQASEPHPAPGQPGVAAQAPAHWNAADREMFGKASPDMQAWALRRHSEMESDYQRRV